MTNFTNTNMSGEIQAFVMYLKECSCSDYWAEFRYTNGKLLVRDGGFENEPIKKTWCQLTEKKILQAVKLILTKNIARRDIAAQFIGEEWEFDDEGADVLLQIIYFGEIKYG